MPWCGSTMGPTDALSHLADPDLSSDNANVTLLPDDLFIYAIDTVLVQKIASSCATNPLVVSALQNLSNGSPLFPCSSLNDWHFSNSNLYFKNCLYIPPDTRHDLVSSVHSSLTSGHGGFFCTYSLLAWDYWWPSMSSFICHFITGCALCQQMKVNTHPTAPTLSLLPHPVHAHSNNFLLTWSLTSCSLMVLTCCWSWSTMAFQRG